MGVNSIARSALSYSRTLPFRSPHPPRSGQCYVTLYAVIFIEINPQRVSFNYPGKMAEQFYKQ